MKQILVFFICLTGLLNTSFAQLIMNDVSLPGKPLIVNKEVKYSGSPYLTEDWHYGSITLRAGTKHENVKVRYNVMDDAIEFWRDGVVFVLDKGTAKEFSLKNPSDGTERIFKNGFAVPEYTEASYFEVVFAGKNHVLKKHTKEMVNDPGSAYGAKLNQMLQDQETLFYILFDNSKGVLKANKKSIASLFPGLQKDIETYIKDKKLNPKNENDLRLIFQFLDTHL